MEDKVTANEHAFRLLVLLAIADKEFHESENKLIRSLLKKNNIEIGRYEDIKGEILESQETFDDICKNSLHEIKDPQHQQDLLRMLFLLSMADKILHEDELRFVELCAMEWGVYGNSLKDMIKEDK